MNIQQVTERKREFIDMLLLADPEMEMIEKYLDSSEVFVLYDQGEPKTIAAITLFKNGKCELKNIATKEEERGKGYGRYMIHFLCEHYSSQYDIMYVGTGNCANTIGFYESCGFVNSHIIANYFVDRYRDPIYENGKRLTDMVYLKKRLDSEVDVKRVVDLALEAGRILLKNGAEIFRVEETMRRICERFHVNYVDTFTLSHGIFITAENGMSEAYTKVKNVPLSSPHLGIVAEVNDLSREIAAGRVSLDEAWKKLREIDKIPPKKNSLQIIAAGISSGTLGYLLGASIPESCIAVGIGCLLYLWIILAKRWSISKIVVNIVGGVVITTLALLAVNCPIWSGIHMNGMIVGAIMPLVPGVAFVNAIRDIADGDFLSGTVKMIDALLVFVYIAIGVGTTLSIYNNMIGGLIL